MSPSRHFIFCLCPWGGREAAGGEVIGLRNGRATLSGSENLRPTSRIGFPECFGVDSPPARARLLGLLSQWDPTGSLSPPPPSGPIDFRPLTSRGPFSAKEAQVLFTLEVCRLGHTRENRCIFSGEGFNLVNCTQTGKGSFFFFSCLFPKLSGVS